MSSSQKRLTARCPFCSGALSINRLSCQACETTIESNISVPPFFRLPADLQEFVQVFLRCRGNIREVEKALQISYPTVCKRLDLVNELLGNTPPAESSPPDRMSILERVEKGEITAKEAVELLKEP